MVEGPPKSAAGERTLAVPKLPMDMLAEHLARRGLTAADADAYVFVGPDGGPLDYSDWYHRDWKPACEAAGVPGLKFHNLRDANITGMVAEGVDVRPHKPGPAMLTPVSCSASTHKQPPKLADRFMRPTSTADECGMDVG